MELMPLDLRANFNVTYTGFEEAQLIDNDYDLVFTSPPFFDFEIYTDLPSQSVDRYRDVAQWSVHFLHASLKRHGDLYAWVVMS